LNQGEIFFEDVRLPKAYMLMGPGVQPSGAAAGGQRRATGGAGSPMAGMSVMFGGLARAAFDESLSYARERVQGAVPIFEHKNIKLKLFEMLKMVESARSLSRRLYMHGAMTGTPSMLHAMLGKWMSTESAFQVASEGVQIFGGNGLSREYPIEKMFRDARAAMIEDGTNEVLALSVADSM
jgi:alkylation response protein AidB-like acyl-CoA dehydrogenase